MGRRAGLQPGRSDENRDGGERVGTEYADPWGRRDGLPRDRWPRDRKGLRCRFEDQGPGIADLELALKDGYTTGGGLGLGLSGSKRLMVRVRGRLPRRRGDAGHRHQVEVGAAVAETVWSWPSRSKPGGRGTPRRRSPWRGGLASSEIGWQGRPRRHRGRDATSSSTPRRGPGPDSLEERRGRGRDPGPRSRAGHGEPGRCLRDGYSTAGTPGHRAGGDRPTFASTSNSTAATGGTALARAAVGATAARMASLWNLEIGAVSFPKAGEEVCGDGWAVEPQSRRSLLLVADGLGHGPRQRRPRGRPRRGSSARTLIATRSESSRHPPPHSRSTRGAAVAVAQRCCTARYSACGVGNVVGHHRRRGRAGAWFRTTASSGHEARKFQEFTYPFPAGALLVMHSDGLATRWSLERLPGPGDRATRP